MGEGLSAAEAEKFHINHHNIMHSYEIIILCVAIATLSILTTDSEVDFC